MAEDVADASVGSAGGRRLRKNPPPRLTRALMGSMGLFVLLVLLATALSLWTNHRVNDNHVSLFQAERVGTHFSRMVERADHYQSLALQNSPALDGRPYAESLRRDIDTMDWMVSDLEQRDVGFGRDEWNAFRAGLEQLINYRAQRPAEQGIESAARYVVDNSGPMSAINDSVNSQLQLQSNNSRRTLWVGSILLALVTLAVAAATAWYFRERVVKRLQTTSRTVRRMIDGEFNPERNRAADDELGQLEAGVGRLAQRTRELIEVLDVLNGASTLQQAIDSLPAPIRGRFGIAWLGLVEIQDGRVRLRKNRPGRHAIVIEQPDTGWALQSTLMQKTCEAQKAVFAHLDGANVDPAADDDDPLLAQLGEAGMVSVALLPVRKDGRVTAGIVLASRSADAFADWRGRWLENVGHLIGHGVYRSIHIERLTISMVSGLAELAEKSDPTIGHHIQRMQRMTGILARKMKQLGHIDDAFGSRFVEQVETFAPLHDIGKVGISDSILAKNGPLTKAEAAEMRRHPSIGADVLRNAAKMLGAEGEKLLAHAIDIALYHHEKFDGTGYPQGVVGKTIPLSARIVAVADVFDVLVSNRPWRKAWSEKQALEYLDDERGKHFDPDVVDAFFACLPSVRRIRGRFDDRAPPEAVAPR